MTYEKTREYDIANCPGCKTQVLVECTIKQSFPPS
jgi:hypothetical protein